MKRASFDWNGNGKTDSWDGAIEIGMIDQPVDEQAWEEHIQVLERAMRSLRISAVQTGAI